MTEKPDVKQILLNLGNRLVSEHEFRPAKMGCPQEAQKDTTPIVKFIMWLDSTPEARQELEAMGLTFIRTGFRYAPEPVS